MTTNARQVTTQDDPHLLPIDVAIRRAKEAATEADWSEDNKPSDHLWDRYNHLKERKRNGEEWEPLF